MPPTPQTRITSIDALRGLTIAFMILVNDPGDWGHVYPPLEHAPWNGFTPTDLVFPNFLFLVGCSVVFSVQSRLKAGVPRSTIARQMLRRAATIFAIKMFLTAFPHFHLTHLRIFGVLTRIAVCYLIAGLIFLYLCPIHRASVSRDEWVPTEDGRPQKTPNQHTPCPIHRASVSRDEWVPTEDGRPQKTPNQHTPCPIHRASVSRDEWVPAPTLRSPWRSLTLITAAILLAYWLLMRFAPIPGLGHPVHDFPLLDPNNNLAAYLDRAFNAACQRFLHTGVLYEKTRDPEGLLSTLPSVATTLLGILAALWLRHASTLPQRTGKWANLDRERTRNGLLLAAVVSLSLGFAWSPWFPINKNLWTSSYVLYAAGWSLLLLAISYWLFDSFQVQQTSRTARALLWPLLVFGSNAITAFAFSNLAVELLLWGKIPRPNASPISAWSWLYQHLFAFNGSTRNTSLAFALAFVALCFLPNWLLWRRKLFLRV